MASKHVAPEILLSAILLFQTVFSATSSVVVVGRVFCDTCLEHRFSETSSYFISGASVAVECSINRRTTSSVSIEGETDEYGEFRVEVPSVFHSLKRCSVRMLGSPETSCNVPSTTASSFLSFRTSNSQLNINLNGDGTYDAGSFSYRPLKVPPTCYGSTSHGYLRGRAALEEASHTAPHVNPQIPGFNFPPFPFPFPTPFNPGSDNSHQLPQIPPFPFTFPSPPPAEEGHDSSKANAESPPTITIPPFPNIPGQPKLNFPPIQSVNPIPASPSPPLPQPPALGFQFPPIPFLNPSPPPADHKAP